MDHAVLIAAMRDLLMESLERERRFMPMPYRDNGYESRAYRAVEAAAVELVRLNDPREERT
jgi:hypothetical protein